MSVKSRESVLSLVPGAGGPYTSGIKQPRRKAPEPKFFASRRELQKRRMHPWKAVLSSPPNEDVFYSSEIKHNKRATRQNFFISATRLHELMP